MAAQSSLGRVTHAVVDAAKAAVENTTDYVVEPIGKALGLIRNAPEAPLEAPAEKTQPKAARKAARKVVRARVDAAVAADKAARRRRLK
jgi:hypothetical protein